MNAPQFLEPVATARAELASAQMLIAESADVAKLLGGQPLGDFNEAVPRLLWFVSLAEVRMKAHDRSKPL